MKVNVPITAAFKLLLLRVKDKLKQKKSDPLGEAFAAPSHTRSLKLCVSLLRGAATQTHGPGQEISQPVTVER